MIFHENWNHFLVILLSGQSSSHCESQKKNSWHSDCSKQNKNDLRLKDNAPKHSDYTKQNKNRFKSH